MWSDDGAPERTLRSRNGGSSGGFEPRTLDTLGGVRKEIPIPHVRASASGGARLLAYTAGSEVFISRGQGRVFVRATPEAEAPEVIVHADGLDPERLVLGAIDESSA